MADFTWVDYVVAVVIAASALLAVVRGLVKEVTSLAIWVLAVVAGSRLAYLVAELMPDWVSSPIRQTLGFLAILVLVLILGKLVTLALKELVSAAGLGVADRILGLVFGLMRGALIVIVLAILSSMTSLPSEPAWQKARTKPFLEQGIRIAAPWLPQSIYQRLKPAQGFISPDFILARST